MKMTIRKTIRAAVTATGVLSAAAAHAATICVNPNVASCHPTIQEGVNAANRGDVVKVAAGVYFENVLVFNEAIQIVGASKLTTVLDASPYVDAGKAGNTGMGISIQARDVTVKNLTIRNGNVSGVYVTEPGAVIQGLNINGPDVAGIQVNLPAWNARILQNEIHNAPLGVYSGAFGTVTQNNVITGVAQGVTLDGDSGQVVGNRIYGGARGISGSADGIVVKGNDVRHQAQEGIFVQGTFPTVQGNKVYGADLGIVAHCTTCFGGSIASNVITDTSSYGILASADDVGLVVQGNTLLRTGQGISVAGFGPTVRLNKATDVGADIEGNCIEVFSDRGTVARNTATRCSAAGVYVRGNEMWVDRNVVSGTFENGLTVDGFDPGDPPTQGTVLAANRATGNSGQGIAIIGGAVDTRVAGNTASGNRLDFCFDGSGLTLADNKFGTLANTPGTDCVIAH